MSGKSILRLLCAIPAAALCVASVGHGVAASAPDGLTGETYAAAAARISGSNGTPVIATVSGNQLEKDDCIVTSWHTSGFLDTSGRNSRGSVYLLNLNCNNRFASPGNPGNSMMNSDAALAKKEEEAASNIDKDPSYCDRSDAHARSCDRICERTGLCEFELPDTE